MPELVWLPDVRCQNYSPGRSFGTKCPYCPYSFDKDSNRLIFEDSPSLENTHPPRDQLIAWFERNRRYFRDTVVITGGEPLLYSDLAFVLNQIPYRFDVTSNTLATNTLEHLPLKRCHGWTASYHPLSGRDQVFAKNIRYLRERGVDTTATVVLTDETSQGIRDTLDFLNELPLSNLQFHLDAHRPGEHLRALAAELGIRAFAGKPRQGVICRKTEDLLALGPQGTLYECVTKMYQDIDALGTIETIPKMESLPRRTETCRLSCFACCDHVKHETPVGAAESESNLFPLVN